MRIVVLIEINNNDLIWTWHMIYMYTYTCTNRHLSQGGVLDNMTSYVVYYDFSCYSYSLIFAYLIVTYITLAICQQCFV